jgi:hypothetical protein
MAEWLLLLLLVPAVVVPVVFLFGYAGCSFQGGVATEDYDPYVVSTDPRSPSVISVTWAGGEIATQIEFERTNRDQPSLPAQQFFVMLTPKTFDDQGLEPATTYGYRVRAILSDGQPSEWSEPPVEETTLGAILPNFDATGAGNSESGFGDATTTWPHTASGNSRVVLVGLRWSQTGGLGTPTRTVTYGPTAMESLGVRGLNDAALTAFSGVYQEFFGLREPPTGAQTVSVTVARGGSAIEIAGCSVSYVEVSAFGSVSSVFGTEAGTSLSQTVNSTVNEMVVQMFATASGSITNYSQSPRFSDPANAFVIGDARGATSVPFTASRANGVDYAGLAVRLTPVS